MNGQLLLAAQRWAPGGTADYIPIPVLWRLLLADRCAASRSGTCLVYGRPLLEDDGATLAHPGQEPAAHRPRKGRVGETQVSPDGRETKSSTLAPAAHHLQQRRRRRKGAGHLFAEAECGLSCDLLR